MYRTSETRCGCDALLPVRCGRRPTQGLALPCALAWIDLHCLWFSKKILNCSKVFTAKIDEVWPHEIAKVISPGMREKHGLPIDLKELSGFMQFKTCYDAGECL